MGKSSKPLNIHLDKSLYDTDKLAWDALAEQGFVLTIVEGEVVDIYFAPHAMRMTSHMLMNMPSARDLAIKGARALRYAPHGTTPTKGKAKNAQAKKPRARKDSTKQVEASTRGAAGDAEVHRTFVGGDPDIKSPPIDTIGTPAHDERII